MIKKKIAIYRSSLLPISETFIRDQASALTTWEPILLGRREVIGGLLTPNLRREIVQEPRNRWTRAIDYWLQRPDPHLVRSLRQFEASLVHAHFGTDATDIWPSVKAAGLPMVVTLHGYDINIHRWWWEKGHGGLRRRVYPRRLLKMAQDPNVHFIAVSNAIKKRTIEYGIPEEKIAVCYTGVDTKRFKPGGLPIELRRKCILFVGRMVEKKAPLLMVKAYAEVKKQIPDAELVMIGIGSLLEETQKLAEEFNLPVDFLGAKNSDEILEQLHLARVLCLPSITALSGDAEGFGMVLLEAQSCGVPVISSALGGADEGLLNGITGYQFHEKDIQDCAKKICILLENEMNAAAMSRSASTYVAEHFDINRLNEDLCDIYSKITP